MANSIFIVFLVLVVFIIFLFRSLILRNRILNYLKHFYGDLYNDIVPNYSVKEIMMGSPEVFKGLLIQERKILSKRIVVDSEIGSLQKKFKNSILLTIIFATVWVLYGLIFIKIL